MRNHHIDCGVYGAMQYTSSGLGYLVGTGDVEKSACTCTAFDHECPAPQMKNRKAENVDLGPGPVYFFGQGFDAPRECP